MTQPRGLQREGGAGESPEQSPHESLSDPNTGYSIITRFSYEGVVRRVSESTSNHTEDLPVPGDLTRSLPLASRGLQLSGLGTSWPLPALYVLSDNLTPRTSCTRLTVWGGEGAGAGLPKDSKEFHKEEAKEDLKGGRGEVIPTRAHEAQWADPCCWGQGCVSL